MKSLQFLLLALAACLIAVPSFGLSGVPSLDLSTATIADDSGQVLTLMVVPDGSGPGFDEARDVDGNLADATITFYLADPADYPVVNFPKEDIWLEPSVEGQDLAVCFPGRPYFHVGIMLDDNTDSQGMASWSQPPAAGGYADAPVLTMVNGSALQSNAGLPLRFNSPDISGDGKVDLADVQRLAVDFYGAYHFRSDLAHDGVINLSDVAIMAEHMGAGCP